MPPSLDLEVIDKEQSPFKKTYNLRYSTARPHSKPVDRGFNREVQTPRVIGKVIFLNHYYLKEF